MLAIHVIGPDGAIEHEVAIDALIEVGDFTKTQAKSLLSALLDMKLDGFEIPYGTQAKLQTLRNAHLLVELVGNPDPDDVDDEEEEPSTDEVWEAWAETAG
jgi:hypothetical protein